MSTGPKQFGWWRRRDQERAANQKRGRSLSPDRLRALASAAIVGGVAWTFFYWTYGNHEITSLTEFERYLQGENLYRKYEVSRLSWDCDALRSQFEAQYLNARRQRIAREDQVLIFSRSGLDQDGFTKWIETGTQRLAYGHARIVENQAMLVPAMMVRLFRKFRFVSGDLVQEVRNEFDGKCRV